MFSPTPDAPPVIRARFPLTSNKLDRWKADIARGMLQGKKLAKSGGKLYLSFSAKVITGTSRVHAERAPRGFMRSNKRDIREPEEAWLIEVRA